MKQLSVRVRRLCLLGILCSLSMIIGTGCSGNADDNSPLPVFSKQDVGLSSLLSRMTTCLFDTGKFDDPNCKFD